MENLTVSAYARLWLEDVRARSHPATVITYERVYRLYIDPAVGDRRLSDVGRPELKALVSAHCARGRSPAMLLRILGNLFSAALDDGHTASQPAAKLWRYVPKPERNHDVKAFTKDELGRFLELAATEPLYSELFETMAFTGARSGEARALQAGDVHGLSRKLDIRRTFSGNLLSVSTKTKAARRIEIPRELAELLGRRAARGRKTNAWLFDKNGKPLRARAVSEAFRRILLRAGLPLHHGTHSLRHTYASNLIAEGCPIVYVQAQLGHRSIQQTVDVYGRWLTLSRRSDLERFVRGAKCSSMRNSPSHPGTSCSSTPDEGKPEEPA